MSGQFAIDLTRFVEKAKGNADMVVRKTALDIFDRVIHRTPVDTGRARGNWACAIDGYSASATGKLDKGGTTTIGNVSKVVGSARAGQVIYLTNTMPYIMPLENGSSKQAPNGMVTVTLTEFTIAIKKAVEELDR